MKSEIEMEEIEAVLEKIWDLHDKLSDAIHSISRAHFLNSIKTLKKSEDNFTNRTFDKKKPFNDVVDSRGMVFVKDLRTDDDESAIAESKSLNAIRTALENLEDQLEFFHTVQIQQRAERDAAIARLEQSRIVLAMRLADHHGKKYKVIEEVQTFIGDVHGATCFVSPENVYGFPSSPDGENFVPHEWKNSNNLTKCLISSLDLARKSLKLDNMGGILGNAALIAVSMLALLRFHHVHYNNKVDSMLPIKHEDYTHSSRNVRGTSSDGQLSHLDVLLARG